MIPYCTSIHANVYRHRSLSGRTFRPRNIKILDGSSGARSSAAPAVREQSSWASTFLERDVAKRALDSIRIRAL
jgi:hypothetical protein